MDLCIVCCCVCVCAAGSRGCFFSSDDGLIEYLRMHVAAGNQVLIKSKQANPGRLFSLPAPLVFPFVHGSVACFPCTDYSVGIPRPVHLGPRSDGGSFSNELLNGSILVADARRRWGSDR